ncbi:thymidylate kinase-domain-containing protein [Paraphysoderma sedebokerense]|nr:thymidylate kinase-domain-containing protein [Paraphysoderma sedebokerense]
MLRRGAFILFEGVDRCGKTTQASKLVKYLNDAGQKTVIMRFPDRTTPIGKMINSYLCNATDMDDHAIHLLFSTNRWEAVSNIKNLLNAGTNIVCDRYAYSGVAFSAAKGLPLSWCISPDIGLPKPDLTVYLDIPINDTMTRGGFGEERYEKLEFQEKVRNVFMDLKEDGWMVIDARKSIDDIHRTIIDRTNQTINDVALRPIGVLWEDRLPNV